MRVVYDVVWESTAPKEQSDAHSQEIRTWMGYMRRAGLLRGCGGWVDQKGALLLLKAVSYDDARKVLGKTPLARMGRVKIVPRQMYYAA